MNRKCLFPFTNVTVNPTGSIAPCCKWDLHNPNKAESELEQHTLYAMSLEDLFKQPAMEKIRQQFRDDQEPEGCKACWDEESAGITSIRQHRFNISKWSKHKDKYVEKLNNPGIVSLDFKFSSLCNLKCRICGPYCSSTWLKESLDTGQYHQHTIKIFSKYSERKFINNEENFNFFHKILPNLHIIEFYGGEPLMQPEHARIMSILDQYPGIEDLNLQLFYNTNGTIYDEQAVRVWNKMAIVELNISVDDILDRLEYQRHPAKWTEVVSNINHFKETCSPKVQINLYCTVNLYNIFYLDEFIKYNAENFKLNLRFNLLHWPEEMSIKHLPVHVKKIIKSKIDSLTKEELSYISQKFDVREIINFMMSNEGTKEHLDKFFDKTKTHDQYRNQDFKSIFPDYWNLLQHDY